MWKHIIHTESGTGLEIVTTSSGQAQGVALKWDTVAGRLCPVCSLGMNGNQQARRSVEVSPGGRRSGCRVGVAWDHGSFQFMIFQKSQNLHRSLTVYIFELSQMRELFGNHDLQKPTELQFQGESKMPGMLSFLLPWKCLADMMMMVLGLVTVTKTNSY